MVPIKIKKLREGVEMPFYATEGAACFDLVAHEIEMIGPDKAIIYLGIASEIPVGWKVALQPRSSFTNKGWVMANSPGQIDSDYRGEWQMRVQAIPQKVKDNLVAGAVEVEYAPLPFKIGDRCIQGSVESVILADFKDADALEESERGEGGFGHTGK